MEIKRKNFSANLATKYLHVNWFFTNTAQKMKFSIKDLVKFTEEMLNGKNLIFCTVQEICFKENLSEIIILKFK